MKNLHKITESLKRQAQQLKNIVGTEEGYGDGMRSSASNANLPSIKKQSSNKLMMGPSSISMNKNVTSVTNYGAPSYPSTPSNPPNLSLIRSASQPNNKGKLVKGINYDA